MATINATASVAGRSHGRSVLQPGRFPTQQELLRFPDKLIRDIAFVAFCPPLLLSSNQLPTVDPHAFAQTSSLLMPNSPDHSSPSNYPHHEACDNSEREGQQALLAWLESLDGGHVAAWFRQKKQSARLGDHYALCILFALTFGPSLKPRGLRTSVQVHVSEVRGKPTRLIFPEPDQTLPEADTSADGGLSEPDPPEPNMPDSSTLLKQSPDQPNLPSLEGFSVPSLELAPARPELDFPELRQMGRRARKRFLRESRERKGRIQTMGEFDVLFTLPPPSLPPHSPSPPPPSLPHLLSPPPLSPPDSKSPGLCCKRVLEGGATAAADDCAAAAAAAAPPPPPPPSPPPITTTTTSSSSTTISGSSSSSSSSSSGSEAAPDWLLGQYLGPHVGESLRDRKERLSRQLLLGKHGYGAQLITRMYGVEGTGGAAMENEGSRESCGVDGITESCGGKEILSSLQAAALLQGYLFYEYPLWLKLREMEEGWRERGAKFGTVATRGDSEIGGRAVAASAAAGRTAAAAGDTAAAAAGTGAPASGAAFYGECAVFPWHWYGWWTHDAAAMVQLPKHAHSRWYIMPKDEWLSPVLVPDETPPCLLPPDTTSPGTHLDAACASADLDATFPEAHQEATCSGADDLGACFQSCPDGIATPLTGNLLLQVIYKCSEEARLRNLPRKLRFLVAELEWDSRYQFQEETNGECVIAMEVRGLSIVIGRELGLRLAGDLLLRRVGLIVETILHMDSL
ncbi:hypothetical protein CLOP_g20934 [Closterium sp. NIES-67]|nr:hypothetical protein CLOP_g20934 [Closterium sp. NIES-67]